ncbi:MAG: hypothetical protein QOG13_522 [Sphingomonadales bacterium]|jgi:hypothetical protein|nr:hypothetical protein [Sphingomonadales bacterium]
MLALTSLAALLLAAAQPPQPAAPEEADIVVRAQTEAEIDRFVAALTQARGAEQIARWNGRICPNVLGLEPGQASYVRERIAQAARAVRIQIGPPRCPANIVIVVTADPDGFTRAVLRRHPRLFRDRNDAFASRAEIAELLAPRPVRWIAASSPGNAYGAPMIDGVNRVYQGSRLTLATRENARFSFIVVDAGKLDRIIWSQLGDYLALVALARPAMDADYDAATILSAFHLRDRGEQGPRRLTAQDRALLRGLYTTSPAVSASAQRGAIRRRMASGEGAAAAE